MHEYETGHAHHALTQNQNRRATRGDGVLQGCEVTAGDSTDSVETDIAAGYVRIAGDVLEVAPDAVTHANNSTDNPRRDVVVAQHASDGEANITYDQGDYGEWSTIDGEEYRYAESWEPQPPSTANSDSIVLAVVSIESGATQSSGILDVEDRRREPAPIPRDPWQQPNVTTPTVNLESDDFYAKPLPVPGDSWIHVWSVAQMRFDDGDRVSWDDDLELSIMEPRDDDSDESIRSTTSEFEFDDGGLVWGISVGGDRDEIQPYWIRLENTGDDMSNEEFWSAQLSVTVDRRTV
ncbi:hypothetical protein [Halostagnicola sp. A-GB9-2]|uniref:hypothetical protein n=1 Tax=Halostagnicola sp. A-GB9-2 TaxID=3048066 RepID=UPI0024BF1EB0|nr:hypothetical protein [Halostagnicola sp. A-GB9-2]MDJ1433581.1 hypothetical protein [Halostagnicola sp. A-GB9-2]